MSSYSKTKKKPLGARVEDGLMEYILQKPVLPGEKIPNEFELAEQFGVGRSTVREAVKGLVSRGILEVRRGSGTYVINTSPAAEDPLGFGKAEDKYQLALDLFDVRLMIEPEMINDPYVRNRIWQMLRKRVKEAKVGVIRVHGNYSIISGDPYALCQSMFGMEVTGLLKAGELYNKYWIDKGTPCVSCFRAPMTAQNNVVKLKVACNEDTEYWYRYMNTCTILNAWDTTTHATNGADKDGDMYFLTDDKVLVENTLNLPCIMCVQRKAKKKVIEEKDLIIANKNSFGDEIGKVTNRVTTMFDVQAQFSPSSTEYQILDYRIKCGELYQQNTIIHL